MTNDILNYKYARKQFKKQDIQENNQYIASETLLTIIGEFLYKYLAKPLFLGLGK